MNRKKTPQKLLINSEVIDPYISFTLVYESGSPVCSLVATSLGNNYFKPPLFGTKGISCISKASFWNLIKSCFKNNCPVSLSQSLCSGDLWYCTAFLFKESFQYAVILDYRPVWQILRLNEFTMPWTSTNQANKYIKGREPFYNYVTSFIAERN